MEIQPYLFEPEDEIVEEAAVAVDIENRLNEDVVNQQIVANRREQLNWCLCGHCVLMDTDIECVCCREIPAANNRRNEDLNRLDCITLNDD